jgi:hypothetical protein
MPPVLTAEAINITRTTAQFSATLDIPAGETFYLLDESGNILTDEAGNRLTWS